MPIEIRELVIRASVSQEVSGGSNSSNDAGSSSTLAPDIVNICVEKVLEIIRDKNER